MQLCHGSCQDHWYILSFLSVGHTHVGQMLRVNLTTSMHNVFSFEIKMRLLHAPLMHLKKCFYKCLKTKQKDEKGRFDC